jgi:hypothetical protein
MRAHRRVASCPVGVMRQYERGSDGTWHDGFLTVLIQGRPCTDDVTGQHPTNRGRARDGRGMMPSPWAAPEETRP